MTAMPLSSLRRRLGVAAAAVLLSASVTACSEAVLEIGDTTVDAAEGSTPAAASATPSPTPTAVPVIVDPALDTVRTDVGSFSLQFPLDWTPMPGIEAVASGDTATAGGAATYSSVPAAGKDQATWVGEMMSGASGVTGVDGNLTQFPAIVQADGREVFHLGQDYAENRAHLYGYVEADVLHLLRFGLDGTEATVQVINRAVATGVHVTPAPTSAALATPAPAAPAPTATTPAATPTVAP